MFMTKDSEIQKLAQQSAMELDRLRDPVPQAYRDRLGPGANTARLAWRLTVLIAEQGPVSVDAAATVLNVTRRSVYTALTTVRRAARGAGLEVRTLSGGGYAFTDPVAAQREVIRLREAEFRRRHVTGKLWGGR
jgi:hypothetical protein